MIRCELCNRDTDPVYTEEGISSPVCAECFERTQKKLVGFVQITECLLCAHHKVHHGPTGCLKCSCPKRGREEFKLMKGGRK